MIFRLTTPGAAGEVAQLARAGSRTYCDIWPFWFTLAACDRLVRLGDQWFAGAWRSPRRCWRSGARQRGCDGHLGAGARDGGRGVTAAGRHVSAYPDTVSGGGPGAACLGGVAGVVSGALVAVGGVVSLGWPVDLPVEGLAGGVPAVLAVGGSAGPYPASRAARPQPYAHGELLDNSELNYRWFPFRSDR